MLPEVQLYIGTIDAAEKAYQQAYEDAYSVFGAATAAGRAAWLAEFPGDNRPQHDMTGPANDCAACAWENRRSAAQDRYENEPRRVRNEALAAAQSLRVAVHEDAWKALRLSDDPLVSFIARECGDYRNYATDVLRILPASLDDIRKMARRFNWCYVYWDENSGFEAMALKAGVVEPSAVPAARARDFTPPAAGDAEDTY